MTASFIFILNFDVLHNARHIRTSYKFYKLSQIV